MDNAERLRSCFVRFPGDVFVHKNLYRGVGSTRENVLRSDWAGATVLTKFDQDHAGSDRGATSGQTRTASRRAQALDRKYVTH